MKFRWRDGVPPPKRIKDGDEVALTAEEVKAALDKLPEPAPELLFNASKAKKHLLHHDLWSEGDQVWANRARLDRCRHIISAIATVSVVGGKEIEVRAIEFLRVNGEGKWANIETIYDDPDLEAAYLNEVMRLQLQAAAKLERYRILKRGE